MAASPEQGRAVIADEGTGADSPERDREVGVGPHPRPWPDDPRLDPDPVSYTHLTLPTN